MKEKSKRLICNISIFLIIALAIAVVVIPKAIGNLDELWNFNFANNVENGLVPYRDFNMVQTPLLPMVNAIFLAIFGNELIVMRILACLLCAGVLFTFYKILNLLKANKGISLFVVMALFYMLKDYFCMDYNFAVLFVTLIIIYIELRRNLYNKENINAIEIGDTIESLNTNKSCSQSSTNEETKENNKTDLKNNKLSNWKTDLILGILAGICIMLKQSTGAIVTIALLGYNLLLVRSKEEFIQYLKSTGIKILGVLIPVAIIFIYLAINGAVDDFWDYCIAGIKTFTNKIPYSRLLDNEKLYIKILSIVAPITFMGTFLYSVFKRNKTFLIISSLSIASFSAAYPIADEVHFLIGILPTGIIICIILDFLIKAIVRGISKLINKISGNIAKNNNTNLVKDNKENKNENKQHNTQNVNKEKQLNKLENKQLKQEENKQEKQSNREKYINIWLEYFLIFMVIGITAWYGYKSIPNIKDYFANCKNDVKHFANIVITDYTYQKIQAMDYFIKSQDKPVYILDAEAALYQIPLDIYYKDYDMFLIGNIGSKGEEGQIEKLQKDTNKIVIIKSDGVSLNWQNPNKVREYVKQNMDYKYSILYFDVYE